jgi:hypothetical protein
MLTTVRKGAASRTRCSAVSIDRLIAVALLAAPTTVESGGEKFAARATPITAGPERDRLYAQHASSFPGFLEYERQTSRTIRVVLLERI